MEGPHYYHVNGHGSTTALTDANGAVSDSYLYDAWGVQLAGPGQTENAYLYTGEQFDSNLGFYYLRARYYGPEAGRFLNFDPWLGNNKDPITLHKYLYANANPATFIDPSGYFSLISVTARIFITLDIAFIGYGGYEIYNGNYASGAFNVGMGFLGLGVFGSGLKFLKFATGPLNAAIRAKYLKRLAKMEPLVRRMFSSGKTGEEVARKLVSLRNKAKVAARAQMTQDGGLIGSALVKLLELRNYWKYGNRVGPSVEWLIARGKTWEEIIESALRSNSKISGFLGVL